MSDTNSPLSPVGAKPASLNPGLIGRLTQSFRAKIPMTAPLTPAAGGAGARLQHALTDLSEAEDILEAYASKIQDLEDVNSLVATENEKFREKLNTQSDELEILNGELTSVRSENDQLEEMLSSLKSRLSITKIDLASANSALLRIAVLERERESAENSVTKLRRDLEKCRQSVTEVESDRDHAQDSLQGAFLELRVAKEKYEKERDERLAVEAELAELKNEMRDLLDAHEKETRSTSRLEKENGSLRTSLKDLEREFAEVHHSLSLTQAQIEEGRAKKAASPSPKKSNHQRVVDLLRPYIKACRLEFEELRDLWTGLGSGIKKDFAEMQNMFEETSTAIKDFRTEPVAEPDLSEVSVDIGKSEEPDVVRAADVSKSEPQAEEVGEEESEEEAEYESEGEDGEYEEESEEESEGEEEEAAPPKVNIDVPPKVPPHTPRKHLPVPPEDSEARTISVAQNEVVPTKIVNAGCCAPLGNCCPFAFAVETPVLGTISKAPCRTVGVICVLYVPFLLLSIVCPPLALFLLNMVVHYGSVDGCCACKSACGRFLYHDKVRICAVLWVMGVVPGIVYSLIQLHVYLFSGCFAHGDDTEKELGDIV